MEKKRTQNYSCILLIPIALFILGFCMGLWFLYQVVANHSTNSFFHNLPFTKQADSTIQEGSRIAYIKNLPSKDEVWEYNFKKEETSLLPISNVVSLYQNPQSSFVFFQKANITNAFNIYALDSKKTSTITIPSSKSYIPIIQFISNGKTIVDKNYFLYSVLYGAKDCHDISCLDVDPKDEGRRGIYSYNITTHRQTYLGDFTIENVSSTGKQLFVQAIYQTQHNRTAVDGYLSVNIQTGNEEPVTTYEQSPSLAQISSLLDIDKYQAFISLQITRGANALMNIQTKSSTKNILSLSWYRLQSSLWLSQKGNYVIYLKEATLQSGYTTYERELYSIKANQTKPLYEVKHTPDDFSDELWIDDSHFLMLDHENLILIDAASGLTKQVTFTNDATLFEQKID